MLNIENINSLTVPNLDDLYQVSGLVSHQSIIVCYGGDGQGKTTAILSQIAMSITQGTMLGRDSKIKRVLYISGEGNVFLPFKVKSLSETFGDLANGLDIIRDNEGDINLFDKSKIKTLILKIQDANQFSDSYDLVIFDNLNAFGEGYNESSANDIALLKSNIKLINNTIGCSTLVVHHSQKIKNGEESEEAKDVRGSSAITSMCDNVWYVHNKQIHCRKTRNGHDFNPIAFSINDVNGVGVATFANSPIKEKVSTKQLIANSLANNPDISNMAIIREVFNPNAKRYTDKQMELINEVRNELQIFSKRTNAKDYKQIAINGDTVSEFSISEGGIISLNPLDNDNGSNSHLSPIGSVVHLSNDTANGFVGDNKALAILDNEYTIAISDTRSQLGEL